MPTPTVSITTTVEVTYEMIANAITGAIENGYSQWMHSFTPNSGSSQKAVTEKTYGQVWYASPNFWADSNSGLCVFDTPNDEEGEGNGQLVIDGPRIKTGLELMAQKSPRHFKDLLDDNSDANTDDVFMQYVVLGDIIYG